MKPLLTSKIKTVNNIKPQNINISSMYIIRVFQFKVYLKHIGETITADEFALTPLYCTFRSSVGNGLFICKHFFFCTTIGSSWGILLMCTVL